MSPRQANPALRLVARQVQPRYFGRYTNHAFQQPGCNTAARYLFADDWAGPPVALKHQSESDFRNRALQPAHLSSGALQLSKVSVGILILSFSIIPKGVFDVEVCDWREGR
jgi:hypothetical protein